MAQHRATQREGKQKGSGSRTTVNSLLMASDIKTVIFLVICSVLLYANTFSNGYAYDDFSVIRDNALVSKGIPAIPELLSTPYRKGYFTTSNDLYRPLSLVTFAAEFQVFGPEPAAGHVVNVLLYACCVAGLFLFLRRLTNDALLAFIGAFLFMVHPVHTEVAANIKSRDELLCFLFSLLSLGQFLVYLSDGGKPRLLYGSLFMVLAILSKETAYALVMIVPAVYFAFGNRQKNRLSIVCLYAIGLSLLMLYVRNRVLHLHHADHLSDIQFIDNPLVSAPGAERIATAIAVMGRYLLLLVVPYPLICDYTYNTIAYASVAEFRFWVPAVIYVAIIIFIVYSFAVKKYGTPALGLFIFLAALLPVSNLFFLTGSMMAERFLFFPSAGFCLAVAWAFKKWLLSPADTVQLLMARPLPAAVLGAIAIVCSVLVFQRNEEWKDNKTLFAADVKKCPANARLHYFVGNDLATDFTNEAAPGARGGVLTEALSELKEAIHIYPGYAQAHSVAGKVFFLEGNYDSAEYYNRQAIRLDPSLGAPYGNLAAINMRRQNYPVAAAFLNTAIGLNPADALLYMALGVCHQHLGKYDSAVYALNHAIHLSPDAGTPYRLLAQTYRAMNKPDSAARYEVLAKSIPPAAGGR